MKRNKEKGSKLFTVSDDCAEKAEEIVRFAITVPPPRREYVVYTKNEIIGKDTLGKNIIATFISRVENRNGVELLAPITDDELARCQQVLREMLLRQNKEDIYNEDQR